MKLGRICAALMLPFLLSSCFLVPGAFTSSLDLRKDGSFTFAYKGEVIFQSPDDVMKSSSDRPKAWIDARARCYKDGTEPSYNEYNSEEEAISEDAKPDDDNRRKCSAAETAKLKQQWEEAEAQRAARKKKDSSEFAAMFGFNPSDDDANQKFAAALMKYEGWKAVAYRGKGVFDVDYQLSSKTGHDFIFPLFPQVDLIIPFVQIRKRTGNAVMVNAPALVGGGMKALMAKAKSLGQPRAAAELPQTSELTRGTFTLTTDGQVLTNNTEDGPTAEGRNRKLVWQIVPTSDKIPEALIQLK